MNIIADENIPFVSEAFRSFGTVSTFPGREITRDIVRDAEILLVRSVTKVDAPLLDGSRVRFVGTSTSGFDHVDREYLNAAGIEFAYAPGSNANSVAEYVAAALLRLELQFSLNLGTMSLGIVGVGHVGHAVQAKALALGMQCVLNDPPLAKATGDTRFRPLDEALACDVVTLHVPLERSGKFATHRLVNDAFLGALQPESVFINTSRGEVVDEAALKRALNNRRLRACVLDVWDHEPSIDRSFLEIVTIGTPHVAGYSYDGKIKGTLQLEYAVRKWLGAATSWDPAAALDRDEPPSIRIDAVGGKSLWNALEPALDFLLRDDHALRSTPSGDLGPHFNRLRKTYPVRREFARTTVEICENEADLATKLAALGFDVVTYAPTHR